MKELKCPCCGAPINRATRKCDYCGTEFEIEDDYMKIRIESFQNPIRTINVRRLIPEEDVIRMRPETQARYMEACVKDMARGLAEKLVDCMTIEVQDNYMLHAKEVRSSVRVVVPEHDY